MILVISPAKTLDFESKAQTAQYTMPEFLEQSEVLMDTLKKLSAQEIGELMHISENLSHLNAERNANWHKGYQPEDAKQAVLAFQGDVYQGMDAASFSEEDFEFAQSHLRILSGLYGLLKPLDMILPYRLEMGTKLEVGQQKGLYKFWDNTLTDQLNTEFTSSESPTLINLASNEYFKAIKPKNLNAEIITPVFKDKKGENFKVISFYAKKARGMMASYIIKNRLTTAEEIKSFDMDGYIFNQALSKGGELVFTRG